MAPLVVLHFLGRALRMRGLKNVRIYYRGRIRNIGGFSIRDLSSEILT